MNLTSLSGTAWKALARRIDQRVRAGDVRSFYEAALADLIAARQVRLELVHFGDQRWIEIDSTDDLARAERLFGGRSLDRARTLTTARAAEAV